jgi:hypothetical protein
VASSQSFFPHRPLFQKMATVRKKYSQQLDLLLSMVHSQVLPHNFLFLSLLTSLHRRPTSLVLSTHSLYHQEGEEDPPRPLPPLSCLRSETFTTSASPTAPLLLQSIAPQVRESSPYLLMLPSFPFTQLPRHWFLLPLPPPSRCIRSLPSLLSSEPLPPSSTPLPVAHPSFSSQSQSSYHSLRGAAGGPRALSSQLFNLIFICHSEKKFKGRDRSLALVSPRRD